MSLLPPPPQPPSATTIRPHKPSLTQFFIFLQFPFFHQRNNVDQNQNDGDHHHNDRGQRVDARINPLVQRTAEMPHVNEYNWQNFPDRQMRFFDAKLRYSGKLHEGIQGVRNELASKIVLIHAKDTDRAREQNLFYRSFGV